MGFTIVVVFTTDIRYTGVRYRTGFSSINFTVNFAGLNNIVRYISGMFMTYRFVISGLHCILSFLETNPFHFEGKEQDREGGEMAQKSIEEREIGGGGGGGRNVGRREKKKCWK